MLRETAKRTVLVRYEMLRSVLDCDKEIDATLDNTCRAFYNHFRHSLHMHFGGISFEPTTIYPSRPAKLKDQLGCRAVSERSL